MGRLGSPQLKYKTIHVAGSKGKGSVARFLALGLEEAGFCTGVYSSPHLFDWRERIQVRLRNSDDEIYADAMEQVLDHASGEETFFDLITATAFTLFFMEKCDVGVIEVGLGGRFDSTSVLQPVAAVVTSIELEHTDVLGPDLASIAWNKAGIYRAPSQAWAGEGIRPVALDVLQNEVDSLLLGEGIAQQGESTPGKLHRAIATTRSNIGHPQPHMRQNFDLAHSILAHNEQHWPEAASALLKLPESQLRLPGRWEKRQLPDGRMAIFDVAHSEQSLSSVLKAFRLEYPEHKRGVVLALRDDKDPAELERYLRHRLGDIPTNEKWWTSPAADHPRSADPTLMAGAFGATPLLKPGFPDGPDVLLITGSTYLVGALRQGTANLPVAFAPRMPHANPTEDSP